MTPPPRFADFLDRLEGRLIEAGLPNSTFVAEARDHLLESFGRLRSQGLQDDAAAREALERFGTAEALVAEWAKAVDLPVEVRMLKLGMAVLATIVGLMAAMVVLHSLLFDHDAGAILTTAKVVTGLLVMTASTITLRQWRAPGSVATGLLFATSVVLEVVGAASMVWTAHLAIVTGDLEAWAAMLGLMLVAQGALLGWSVLFRHRDRAA